MAGTAGVSLFDAASQASNGSWPTGPLVQERLVINLTFDVTVYSGWRLDGVDYEPDAMLIDDLGRFLELEVVLEEDQSTAEGEQIANDLLQKLGVPGSALISRAYIDLLEKD